ncbi:hypothetical protein TNCV_1748701 [Trichonephila clavipes]|nr:hypothetical protein TNCV_1748701 [Trichonephila clavipes]
MEASAFTSPPLLDSQEGKGATSGPHTLVPSPGFELMPYSTAVSVIRTDSTIKMNKLLIEIRVSASSNGEG